MRLGLSAFDDLRLDGVDDGASWQLLHDFSHPVIWLEMDPNDSETMYASVVHSSAGGVFVTAVSIAPRTAAQAGFASRIPTGWRGLYVSNGPIFSDGFEWGDTTAWSGPHTVTR